MTAPVTTPAAEAHVTTLTAEHDAARAMIACPIGIPVESRGFCSAGTCYHCLADRCVWSQEQIDAAAEARTATLTKRLAEVEALIAKLAALRDPVPAPERGDAGAEAMRTLPTIEFHQQDWIPGFAAFLPGATTPEPNSRAFCVLNLGSFIDAFDAGVVEPEDIPAFVIDSMIHEVGHALEQWAGVEFSEARIEALTERYRAALPFTTPQQDRVQGEESGA